MPGRWRRIVAAGLGAWVLWETSGELDPRAERWRAVGEFGSRAECERVAVGYDGLLTAQREYQRRFSARGYQLMLPPPLAAVCLPAGVEPGPPGGAEPTPRPR